MTHECYFTPKNCKNSICMKKKCSCIRRWLCNKCSLYFTCKTCYDEHECYTITPDQYMNTLTVNTIRPLYCETSIGSPCSKFDKIYAKWSGSVLYVI